MTAKINTYAKLVAAEAQLLPDASIDVDNYGQLIIYTNLSEARPSEQFPSGTLVPFDPDQESGDD